MMPTKWAHRAGGEGACAGQVWPLASQVLGDVVVEPALVCKGTAAALDDVVTQAGCPLFPELLRQAGKLQHNEITQQCSSTTAVPNHCYLTS